MEPQEYSFEDEIIPNELPVHTEPIKDRFLPWHRVRKEYIRRFQWGKATQKMVKRYWRELQHSAIEWSLDEATDDDLFQIPGDMPGIQPLRCLVIPGPDLLDVRALCRDVKSLNCLIRYLGFNSSAGSDQHGTNLHVANNAVASMPTVSPHSVVAHDRFESISKTTSQAYRYLKDNGPYHVVNLDLCGSMFPNVESEFSGYYEALHSLLNYQFNNQTSEWLLFITTMVEPRKVDQIHLQKLCKKTRDNVIEHHEFAECVATIFPSSAFTGTNDDVNVSDFSEEQMISLFGVAFGKWLLALCQTADPKWSIAMRSVYQYKISENAGAVMLSFAFELKRNVTPPIDQTGMSNLQPSARTFPDEKTCAIKAAKVVSKRQNVDDLLNNDEVLKTELKLAQADLLDSAGYDREAYIKWVDGGEVIP